MPELVIPLDPMNPGQYYACCGLAELFDLCGHETISRFELNSHRPRFGAFHLESSRPLDLPALVEQVRSAHYEPLPGPEETILPVSAKLPCGAALELDWWLDEFRLSANSLKFWGGQMTSLQLFRKLPGLLPEGKDGEPRPESLFRWSTSASSRLGVDPRSSWNALDFGSSPNEQKREAATFPCVELLAAFGLQGFRPVLQSRVDVRYSLWTVPLPRAVARLVAAAGRPFPCETRRTRIGKRGQGYKFFTFAEKTTEREQA